MIFDCRYFLLVPGVPFGAFDTADFWAAMNASSLQKFSVVIQKVLWGMCHNVE